MSWVVPGPDVLTGRYVAALESLQFEAPDGTISSPDATDPNTIEAALARTHGGMTWEIYLYQQYIAREMMVDTAVDYLPRHAAIWNVPRSPAKPAVGLAIATNAGATIVTIPQGTEMFVSNTRYTTTAVVQIPASGTVSAPIEAEVAGVAGNQGAGTVLTLVSAAPGVAQQQLVVDQNGLEGGVDIEEIESWRARIVAEIQVRQGGGRESDYVQWAREAGAAFVGVYPGWVGAGSVGVVVAMAGPRQPTPAELLRIQGYIDSKRPVTASAVVVAAVLEQVNLSIALNPDTTATRSSAQNLLAAAFAAQAEIGTPWYESSTAGALAGVPALTSSRIVAPSGDVAVSNEQMPVLGVITWVDPY